MKRWDNQKVEFMKYVLIFMYVFSASNDIHVTSVTQEFLTEAACLSAGSTLKDSLVITSGYTTYVCVAKGETVQY